MSPYRLSSRRHTNTYSPDPQSASPTQSSGPSQNRQRRPYFLDGAISFPNGVVGTIQYTAGRIVAETHLSVLAAAPPSPPAPLRVADLRSLAQALQLALSDQPGIDPAWQQVLTLTQNELQ